jgi:hypothetical protein
MGNQDKEEQWRGADEEVRKGRAWNCDHVKLRHVASCDRAFI